MTAAALPPSITCPVCAATSYHPRDIAEGYCGQCHDWTSEAEAITDGVAARYTPGRYPPNFSLDLADQPMPPRYIVHDDGSIG